MKLKTLKDCYMSDGRNYEQRLREEAIKWIKELQKKDVIPEVMLGRSYAVLWIKHFFNITEEDLK